MGGVMAESGISPNGWFTKINPARFNLDRTPAARGCLWYSTHMIQDFIDTFLSQAQYEMIDGGKRFYAEIKALRGVWATGRTLEECRTNLLSALEGWLIFRLRNRLAVPHFKVPVKTKTQKVYA